MMIPEEEKIRIINNIKTFNGNGKIKLLTQNDISLLNDFADNKISMEDAMQRVKSMFF